MKEIKVKTIAAKHVNQLPIEHYWNNVKGTEFDWSAATILGVLAGDGCILCRVKGQLRRVAPIAYIDRQFALVGGLLPNGEYAPTPHTKYSQAAKEKYEALERLFID